MKYRLLLLLTLLTIDSSGFAQRSNDHLKSSVYVELFGNSYTYSLNFEQFLYKDPFMAISVRAGAGYLPPDKFVNTWNSVFGFNVLLGSTQHYVEGGAAYLTLLSPERKRAKNLISFYMGYRYQPKSRGLLFRAGLTPYYTPFEMQTKVDDVPLTLYGGFSLGFAF